MSIFGTRPEAIKMAPVVKMLESRDAFEPITVVTGQHREMLDQVLEQHGIVPDFDLAIMKSGQSLFDITRNSLAGLESVLARYSPDLVLVQGDTTTAFVAALAAFYRQIPVGHVEAGLRTNTVYDPFPEEMNRRLLSTLARLHFAPTHLARDHLLACGVSARDIFVTGNTVTDALEHMLENLPAGLPQGLVQLQPGARIVLVETHRRENLGAPMEEICKALRIIVKDFTNLELVFSVHKNPRVREVVMPALTGVERVHLLEPVDYPVLLRLMRESTLILTDSGGIQEEAPSLGKPVLVLRRTTERPEGVEAGVARLVGTDHQEIVSAASRLLSDAKEYEQMSRVANPYGDARAAERIADAILYSLKRRKQRPEDFRPACANHLGGAAIG